MDKEKGKEISVTEIVKALDEELRVDETVDPAMSRFVPMVYDPIGFDWKTFFEPGFVTHFNGLMINGGVPIKEVVLLSFLTDYMVEKVLSEYGAGTLIFAHHPVQMECGDPQGAKGKGFLPIDPELLKKLKEQGISVYTCHGPLDAGSKSGLGTCESIVNRLNARVIEQYYPYAHGFAARLCELPEDITVAALIEKLKKLFGLEYVDLQGIKDLERRIHKVVILPGGGGSVNDIKPAEEKGADAIITGQVTCGIDNERGKGEQAALEEYYPTAKITAIGLSHAGSEFLVMYDVAKWMTDNLSISATPIPEKNWWR